MKAAPGSLFEVETPEHIQAIPQRQNYIDALLVQSRFVQLRFSIASLS